MLNFLTEDGGRKVLRSLDTHLPKYMALYPRNRASLLSHKATWLYSGSVIFESDQDKGYTKLFVVEPSNWRQILR